MVKIVISEAKSTATVFTSWTKEVNKELDIRIYGKYIPTVKYPKVLGVTFDNLHTFAKHAETWQIKSGIETESSKQSQVAHGANRQKS